MKTSKVSRGIYEFKFNNKVFEIFFCENQWLIETRHWTHLELVSCDPFKTKKNALAYIVNKEYQG